jgi:cell division control protein 12
VIRLLATVKIIKIFIDWLEMMALGVDQLSCIPAMTEQLNLSDPIDPDDQSIVEDEKLFTDEVESPLPLGTTVPSLAIAAPKSTLERYKRVANSTDGNESQILRLAEQRCKIVSRRGAVFSLVVAGESGLGKTTFVNTLFKDEFKPANSDRSVIAHSKGKVLKPYEKTTTIEIKQAVYDENGFTVKFTVIDTPGFGDYTNNDHSWVPIINYIDEQHRMYMLQEEQPNRTQLVDTRVHACLYFIRPSGHGLLPLDIRVMKELSGRVNLIPIIAKADSFMPQDRDEFKERIRQMIIANNIQVYAPPVDDNTEDDEFKDLMPFAIISSQQLVTLENGQKVRGRQYRWGVAEIDNANHCDFAKLREVLMSKYMLDLIDTTVDKHYYKYRQEMMLKRIRHAQEKENERSRQENDVPVVISEEGGINTLQAIAPFGWQYLQEGYRDNDPIFLDRKNRVEARIETIVTFQEQKFDQWWRELSDKQTELNQDIANTKAMFVRKNHILLTCANYSVMNLKKELGEIYPDMPISDLSMDMDGKTSKGRYTRR